MQSHEENIQERLGAALHALTFIEQQASAGPEARRTHALLKQCRQLVADLEHGFALLQQATSQHAALRREVEAASTRAGLLFDLSPVPCVVVDETGTIAEANAAATRFLNTSLRYLHAKSFDLFLGAERESFNAWLRGLSLATTSERRRVLLRPREQRPKPVIVVGMPETAGRVALMVLDLAGMREELDTIAPVEAIAV